MLPGELTLATSKAMIAPRPMSSSTRPPESASNLPASPSALLWRPAAANPSKNSVWVPTLSVELSGENGCWERYPGTRVDQYAAAETMAAAVATRAAYSA